MKMSRHIPVVLFLCCAFFSVATSIELDGVGRVVRGQLESLYNLRHKLGGTPNAPPQPAPPQPTPPASLRKESRGYAFHYSPSEVTLPAYSTSYSSSSSSSSSAGASQSSFSNRLGKLDEPEQDISIISQPQKKLSKIKAYENNNKYSKHANAKSIIKDSNSLNSFNVHQVTKSVASPPAQESTTSTNQPSNPVSPTTAIPLVSEKPAISMDLPSIQTIGQGLNHAMTAVLTQKLMGMLDQDVPHGLLNPLRHLVASGNRMIEFWDKRTNARDGKKPGIVEMLGYGLDQLKGFRDGQAIKSTDPVANVSTASQTLIQGMITVKRLTNRVLGYDTTNEVESRGGYGHDSYGHGGGYGQYMSSGHYLDPYAILATLGFGVFLFNVIFNLLNNNMASGRSLDVYDLDVPLGLSDVIGSSRDEKYFGTPTVRNKREVYESNGEEENMFYSIVDKLDGMYKTYKQVSEKPKCARLHLCRLAVDEAYMDEASLLSPLYIFGLGHIGHDTSASQFVKSIKDRVINGEDIDCDKLVTNCTIPVDKH